MSPTTINQIIIILGLGLVMIELFLNVDTGFDLFIFGLITIASGAVGLVFGSFWTSLVLTLLTSLTYWFFFRKKFKQSIVKPLEEAYSIDAVIGQKARVIKEITPNRAGAVMANGIKWRAKAKAKLKPGQEVRIKDIKGITLFVEKLKPKIKGQN